MQPLPAAEPLRPATILIAEDHEDSREAVRLLLEATGYRTILASNGREAVELAIAATPDLILMDVMMPECDGVQATRMLRAREDTCGIPIIVVTAMEGARTATLEAGADDYIRKPVDTGALLTAVRRWMGRR